MFICVSIRRLGAGSIGEHRQQLRASTTANGAIPEGTAFHDFCSNGDCLRGDVSAEVYGVEVYSGTTGETLYYTAA
jgi:hypothetical protein